MEIINIKDHKESSQKKKAGQASSYQKAEKFVPPTHPAYVVTSNFTGPHIIQLQEQFDRNYIAMSMQTSKKKLVVIPDSPTDKFFIVVDDSMGPLMLLGQFLSLNKKVVSYPISTNLKQVIEEFNSYIGLGHLEITQQRAENRYNEEQLKKMRELEIERMKIGVEQTQNKNRCIGVNHASSINQESNMGYNGGSIIRNSLNSSVSKIIFREISSRRQELKVSKGKLFIYDNRKDIGEFKSLVEQIRRLYCGSEEIKIANHIDQYNYYCSKNEESANILLMSLKSYLTLSEYFSAYHSLAIFGDGSDKMSYHKSHKIVLFTADKSIVLKFVKQFWEKKQIMKQEKVKSMVEAIFPINKQGENQNQGKIADLKEEDLKKDHQNQYQIEASVQKRKDSSLIKAHQPNLNPNLLKNLAIGKQEQYQSSLNKKIPFLGGKDIKNDYCLQVEPILEKKGALQLSQFPEMDGNKMKIGQSKTTKSKIVLVKVTDLNEQTLKNLKLKRIKSAEKHEPNHLVNSPQIKEEYNMANSPSHLSPSSVDDKRQLSAMSKSKIKRLKSSRKINEVPLPSKNNLNVPIKNQQTIQPKQRSSKNQKCNYVSKSPLVVESNQQKKLINTTNSKEKPLEGSQGRTQMIPSIVVSESRFEQNESYLRSNNNEAVSSKKKIRKNQQLDEICYQLQPTIEKLLESNRANCDNKENQTPFVQKQQRNLESPPICNQNSSLVLATAPLGNKSFKQEQSDDDNAILIKKSKAVGHAEQVLNKQQELKLKKQEKEDNVLIYRVPKLQNSQNELKNFKNKVEVVQKKQDQLIERNRKLKNAQSSEEKKKKIVIKVNSIPPETQNIQNSSDEKEMKIKSPNLAQQILLKQGASPSLRQCGSSKLFGDSQPSSIKNFNPLIVVNSPKKLSTNPDPRFSFGELAIEAGLPLNRKGLKVLSQQQRMQEEADEAPNQFASPKGSESKILPLRSRRINDKEKGKNLVNKIFNKGKEKSRQKDIPQVTQTQDSYCLPVLKPLKKRQVSSEGSNFFLSYNKKEEKIGKIYNPKKNRSGSVDDYQSNPQKSIKYNEYQSFPSKFKNSNGGFLPVSSLPAQRSERLSRQTSERLAHSISGNRGLSNLPKGKQSVQNYLKNSQPEKNHQRSISDMIDLNKYEKCIENGVTIYRAKQPIVITYTLPKGTYESQKFSDPVKARLNQNNGEYSPYEHYSTLSKVINCQTNPSMQYRIPLQSAKEKIEEKFCYHPSKSSQQSQQKQKALQGMNEEIKALTYKICTNLLASKQKSGDSNIKKDKKPFSQISQNNQRNINESDALSRRSPLIQSVKADHINPDLTKKDPFSMNIDKKTKQNNPAQSLVDKSKHHHSSVGIKIDSFPGQPRKQSIPSKKQKYPLSKLQQCSPPTNKLSKTKSVALMKKSLQSPFFPEMIQQNDDYADSQSSNDGGNQNCDHMVVYLIDKNKEIDYPEIQLLKEAQDSLIYFKNQRQLLQQLTQTEGIYDLVFVVSSKISQQMRRVIMKQPNCYIVSFGGEQTIVKEKQIYTPSAAQLKKAAHVLIDEISQSKNKRGKSISPGCYLRKGEQRGHRKDENNCGHNYYQHFPTPQRCGCRTRIVSNCNACGHYL